MLDLGRRAFLTLLGGAAAWPFAARAQQSGLLPVIGFLSARSPEESAPHVASFRRGLSESGYDEGNNVVIDYRWADGQYERLPALASDLVARRVNVLAAIADPSPQAAKAATQTIPIVFAANGDPLKAGLVASLNRPGGNATGITIFGPDAVTKRLQLLHELVPHARVISYVTNPNSPGGDIEMEAAREAARALGKEMLVLNAGNEHAFDAAFATIDRRTGALLFASDPFFVTWRNKLVALTARYQIPAIYYLREFAEAGGLMAYGNGLSEVYRLVGLYIGRILKGEKPADLPVQQSTKFELVINLKAAKALGLSMPQTLLVSADEVIE